MYQLISKEWGLENGSPMRLEHYVADSKEETLPDAPVGSDCLFPDGSRAVRFSGGWTVLPVSAAGASITRVTVTEQGEATLSGCCQTVPCDLEVLGLVKTDGIPTPSAPVTPVFLDGVDIAFGNSEAIGEVVLRRVGDVADSLMLDGRIVRRIGVYTLTGEEPFTKMNDQYFAHCYSFILQKAVAGANTSVCSHFKNVVNSFSIPSGAVGYYCDHAKQKNRYFDSDLSTVEAFTSWLKSEYDKGTPVTLWYVKENEEIEQANEALCNALAALRLTVGETVVSVTDGSEKEPLYRVTYEKSVAVELSDLRTKTEELEAAVAAIG